MYIQHVPLDKRKFFAINVQILKRTHAFIEKEMNEVKFKNEFNAVAVVVMSMLFLLFSLLIIIKK